MSDWADDLGRVLTWVGRATSRFVRWLPTLTILLVVAIVYLHRVHPQLLESLGTWLGIGEPAAVATLIVSIFVLERVFHLQAIVQRPPVQMFSQREQAYKDLATTIRQKGAKTVDLLQFSGITALDVIKAVAERSPSAKIRLLLAKPEKAAVFDSDDKPNHEHRITTTVQQVGVMEQEYEGFRVDIRYYETPPSVSSVAVDGKTTCISWYHAFPDEDVVRIRGHRAPALTVSGGGARAVGAFAESQFEKLWSGGAAPTAAAGGAPGGKKSTKPNSS